MSMDTEEKMRYLEQRQMVFVDFFDRPYKVDMFRMVSQKYEEQQ